MSNFQPVNPQQYMQQQGQQQNPYVQGMQQMPQQPQQQEAQKIEVDASFFSELAEPKSSFLSPKECPPDGWVVRVTGFDGVYQGTWGPRPRVFVEVLNDPALKGQPKTWDLAPTYYRVVLQVGGFNPAEFPTKCAGVIVSVMATTGNNGKKQFVVTQLPSWALQNLQQQGIVTPSQPPQEEAFPTS